MSIDAVAGAASVANLIREANVLRVLEDGTALVSLALEPHREVRCTLLVTSDRSSSFVESGDAVLVWQSSPCSNGGVVLGRIGREEPQTEVVIEARENLTLRVGDGSITIRADGKILIKGKDLVSHATRTNRIKGGSVTIN